MIDIGQINEAISIAKKGTGVANIEGGELRKKSKIFLKFIFTDLGLRDQVSDYDIARFLDYLTKYYKFITLEDIKLMFELYVIGRLPNVKDHWGKWSANFYISVVKSYIFYQMKKQQEDVKALPAPKITQKQIDDIRNDFVNYVVVVFNRFKAKRVLRDRDLGLPVYEFWKEKGLLEEIEITEADKKMSMKELFEEMKVSDNITEIQKESRYKSNAMRRMVRELYYEWFEQGKNIQEFLK